MSARKKTVDGRLVDLSPADIEHDAQKEADWQAGTAARARRSALDARAEAYPAPVEVLGALVAATVALADGLPVPAEARAVLDRVVAADAANPLPRA